MGHITEDSEAQHQIVHVDLLWRIIESAPKGVTVSTVLTPSDIAKAYNLKSAEAKSIQGYPLWDIWLKSFQPLVTSYP